MKDMLLKHKSRQACSTESTSVGKENAENIASAPPPGLTKIKYGITDVADTAAESGSVDALRNAIKKEITSYTESIIDNPDNAELYRRLGILKLLLKQRRSALEEYRVLKDIFPSMADELMRKWNIRTPF